MKQSKHHLNVAVVGLGVGIEHIEAYLQIPNIKLTSLCDSNTDRLEQIGKKYNIKNLYSDYNELLAKESLDLISITTPNFLHKTMTIKALENNINVLCEKPIAMNENEAIEMKNAEKKSKAKLMICYNNRFRAESAYAKRLIENNKLGDLYYIKARWLRRRNFPGLPENWFGQKEKSGGGALIDLGIHMLDLSLWLSGFPEIKSVSSISGKYVSNSKQDVDDFTGGMIRFKNDSILSFEFSWDFFCEENEPINVMI